MWRAVVSALGFLTRFPVPNVVLTEVDVALGAGFFSWVGGLIAAVLWLCALLLSPLGSACTAMCVVALWAFMTGALHLDGLADTIDGLSGGRGDRERTLNIMRDSRIGAHGATALCLALGLKWVALERALELSDERWIIAPTLSRFACTLLLATFTYARSEGLGSAFAKRVGVFEVVLGALSLVPLYAWLGPTLLKPAAVGVGLALLVAYRARRVLGGLTGDVHGAAIEVAEVGILLSLGLFA